VQVVTAAVCERDRLCVQEQPAQAERPRLAVRGRVTVALYTPLKKDPERSQAPMHFNALVVLSRGTEKLDGLLKKCNALLDQAPARDVEEVEVAGKKGVWAIGSESDMSRFAPEHYLTGTVWNWCPFYKRTAEMVRDGTFVPGEFYGGLEDGTVSLAPMNDAVPEKVQNLVARRAKGLIEGRFDYWQGPLMSSDDREVVEPGAGLTLAEIYAMDWLLKGVDSTKPK